MPEISSFYGIIIRMFFDDHPPPHFHAEYGDKKAMISINNLEIIEGKLPHRALRLVRQWASLHQSELNTLWNKSKSMQSLGKIDPLQ